MKRLLSVAIALILAVSLLPAAFAAAPVPSSWTIEYNGEAFDSEGVLLITADSNIMQLRALFQDLLGYTYDDVEEFWDGDARTLTVPFGDNGTIVLTIGSTEAVVYDEDGEEIDTLTLAIAPQLVNNRAYIPFRFLCETVLGMKVYADINTRTIHLVSRDFIDEVFAKLMDIEEDDYETITVTGTLFMSLFGIPHTEEITAMVIDLTADPEDILMDVMETLFGALGLDIDDLLGMVEDFDLDDLGLSDGLDDIADFDFTDLIKDLNFVVADGMLLIGYAMDGAAISFAFDLDNGLPVGMALSVEEQGVTVIITITLIWA